MWPTWRPSSSRRGMTLAEALLSTGLLGMILVGVYASLVLAMRYQAKLSDSVETFQRALLVTTQTSYALGNGAQRSLVVEPEGFAFVSARPERGTFTHDPTGMLQWHCFEFFYLEQGSLYRGTVGFPATVSLPATPPLATLRVDPAASRVLVAEGVEELIMTSGSGATTKLKVRGRTGGAKTNSVTLETRVTFRQ